jgi:hypothetical protein
MKINLKDFPRFSLSHYEDLMSMETPILQSDGYSVKRDDLFEIGNIRGGKVRQCLKVVYDNLDEIKNNHNGTIITGCGLPSPQSTITSSVAKYFGLKSVIVSPIYDNKKVDVNRLNVSISQKLGSEIYGVGNPNPSGYKLDVKKLIEEHNYYEIKFGMDGDSVIDTTSHQVKNIPNDLENIVVICGSGLNLLGILKGVVRYKKNVKNIYGITLSKFFEENKKIYYDGLSPNEKYDGDLKIVSSPYPYQKLLKSNKDWIDWVYENKAYTWMLNNLKPSKQTLFWCVGVRNYDLKNVEPIRWKKSKYEKSLDLLRVHARKPKIEKTDLHKLTSNITYDDLQNYTFEEVSEWVDELKNEIVDLWKKDKPPIIGKSKDDVVKSFKKLKDYDLSKIWVEDKNYPHHIGHIKNFTKVPINQFFPTMYETRIDRQPSIKDFFFDENLKTSFKRSVVRNTRFDGMYSYTSYLVNPNGVADEVYFKKWRTKLKGDEGFYLDGVYDTQNHQNNGNLYISTKSVKNLVNEKILNDKDFRNILDFDGREPIGYNVRTYDKKKKIIPSILQVFRLGLGTQPAVNFPPLTSRLIYEKYLNDQDQNIVWDMCSGFGGRLLGALSSNRKIKYLGTDTNTSLKGHYENLGDFYNTQCKGENDFEIYYEPAETFNQNKTYQKYKGQGDLCFTSPPYFGREIYSLDKEQSCIKYPNYSDWLDGFLSPMIKNCWDFLKPNSHMILNVADIKMGDKDFIPLEQDTIQLAIKQGFKYQGKIDMVMSRMIGVKTENVKNNYFDMNTKKTYKTEPILVMVKH